MVKSLEKHLRSVAEDDQRIRARALYSVIIVFLAYVLNIVAVHVLIVSVFALVDSKPVTLIGGDVIGDIFICGFVAIFTTTCFCIEFISNYEPVLSLIYFLEKIGVFASND